MAKSGTIAAALLPIIIVGLINNSRNIRVQRSYYFASQDDVDVAPKPAKTHRAPSQALPRLEHGAVATVEADCFTARADTVPRSLYQKLPKPYINLGFPKMGTSSLYAFFQCGGLKATHFRCGKHDKCAKCTRQSVEAGQLPLAQCTDADVHAQLDDAVYFPQIELLEELVHGYPDATFFLTFRSMEKWYHSITHWPPRKNGPFMADRMKKMNITGGPPSEGRKNPKEFSDWYCNHVRRVRDIVAANPSHALVEVDIEDPEVGQRMEDIFGIEKSCWGHTNVNVKLHPEVNTSEVVLSKMDRYRQKQHEKESIRESEDVDDDDDVSDSEGDGSDRLPVLDSEEDDDESNEDDDDDDDIDDNERTNTLTEDADADGKQEERRQRKDRDQNQSQSPDVDPDFFKQDCFKARKDTVPRSLYQKLPKPYINLGFPKMGTTSLHSFFQCGGLKSMHFRCGKKFSKCALCTQESVDAGLPPLAKCGEADVYAQIDNGKFFPQIELLEEFVHGHPNATFFLTFRSMEKWYHSITHWPPRKNGPHMDERFRKLDITGLPAGTGKGIEDFAGWYCSHVNRVRDLVSRNPSHTLVEVDIEDPEIGQRMEDIFGVDKSCWGHSNANAFIHPELNRSEVAVSHMVLKREALEEEEARKEGESSKKKKKKKRTKE